MLSARHCFDNIGDSGGIGNSRAVGRQLEAEWRGPGVDIVGMGRDSSSVGLNEANVTNLIYRTNNRKAHQITASTTTVPGLACLFGKTVGRACGAVNNRDAGFYRLEGVGYSESFTFRVNLPGRWTCDGFAGSNSPMGSSGGAITAAGTDRVAVGIGSSCISTQLVGPASNQATILTLRGAPLAPLIGRTGDYDVVTAMVN